MYLHECYVVPKAALVAVVEYLRKRPFEDVAGLLQGLDGSPEGKPEELLKAGVCIHPDDGPVWSRMANGAVMALEAGLNDHTGETVVDFPAGVGRRE